MLAKHIDYLVYNSYYSYHSLIVLCLVPEARILLSQVVVSRIATEWEVVAHHLKCNIDLVKQKCHDIPAICCMKVLEDHFFSKGFFPESWFDLIDSLKKMKLAVAEEIEKDLMKIGVITKE